MKAGSTPDWRTILNIMSVNRCICYDIPFQRLKEIALKKDIKDIEDLRNEEEFGLCCGMCNFYIEKILKTGKTLFEV